jgi:hypothetical protein
MKFSRRRSETLSRQLGTRMSTPGAATETYLPRLAPTNKVRARNIPPWSSRS